jgi:EAL domain-containing protein (putative c-di-GMP-specific phosphodiesterase class I)
MLTPAYQPVFDLDSGSLTGFEALARLTDENGLGIPPDVFIGVAEQTGLIRSLGLLMLDRACAQLAVWRTRADVSSGLTMAVNVSPLQASHSFLEDDVRETLQRHALAPTDLMLELTENALLQAGPSTLSALQQLHDEGVGIAIDDFGTGYASLHYLATLPVTTLKIDKSFTAGLPDDATCAKIVRSVAGLAADMSLGCIVEGVETTAQLQALPAGVQVQGYLTGRPTEPALLDLQLLARLGIGVQTPERQHDRRRTTRLPGPSTADLP